MSNRLGFVWVGVAALLWGCAGEVSEGDGGSGGSGGANTTTTSSSSVAGPTFTELYQQVLAPRSCTSPYCHGSFGSGALDDVHAAYVSILSAVADGEGCGDAKVVIPGDPEHSMLYLKVSMDKPPCGERMPVTTGALPAAEIELIRAWIAAGAVE